MKLAQLLVFRLRLDRGARFRFFHNPTVYAYLMDRLGTPPTFPKRCFFLAPESGRSCYEPGDEYRFGLVLLPGAEMDAAGWGHRLRRGPRSPWALKRGAPLGQGAELVEVVDGVTGQVVHDPSDAQWLTLRQVERAAFGLAGQRRVTLTFQSPLLILRTPVHTSRFFMDDRVVDGATVLHRVRARVHEHFPGLAPLGPAPAVAGVVNGLVRADAKYPNKTLLGSVGSVTLELGEPLSAPWARALVLAGLVGIGKSTTMGQGRYGVEGAEPTAAWPPQPAQTCCERAARSSVVERVLASMRTAGPDDGGSDDGCEQGGVTERELEGLMARSSALRDALARGRVGAAPSLGLRASVSGGAVDPLVALALEDRFLQQCCYEELAPSLGQLVEDSGIANERGLSRHRCRKSLLRARDDGFVHRLDGDLRRLYDTVDWLVLERRLRGLLGDDPMVELLMGWVRAPMRVGSRLLPRTHGLPQDSVLSPLLALVMLDRLDDAATAQGHRLVRQGDGFAVMCRSEAEVTRERDDMARELERLRLELASREVQEAAQ